FRHSRGQTRCDLPWSFPCALWPLHCWSCCSAAAEVPPAPPLTLRLEARPRWVCRHLSAAWRRQSGWKFPTTTADACLSSSRAGDPQGNGQNLQTLLGKILRIDVDGAFAPGKQYAIPADNPFTPPGGLPEIWAYGLRNPWRFSFDRATGKLFAGDVGQNSFEEVDIITRAGNFGWNKMEASHCYPPGSLCSTAGLILPIMEYAHNSSGGEAIIGGFFYRGFW